MAGKHYESVIVGTDVDGFVTLSDASTDGYFVWTCINNGRRVGLVQSSSTSVDTIRYLQVLIELPADPTKRQALIQLADSEAPCLRPRGAFKKSTENSSWDWRTNLSYATALVQEDWLVRFIQEMQQLDIRWEMAHPRGNLESSRSSRQEKGRVKEFETDFSKDSKLKGKVMVIIDHGCPFAHPEFRRVEATGTRVRYLWLQDSGALRRTPQQPPLARPIKHGTGYTLFPYGWDLRGAQLDELMRQCSQGGEVDEGAVYERLGYDLMRDISSHGAHVMSVACGHPNPLERQKGEAHLFGYGAEPAMEAVETALAEGDLPDPAGACEIIFIQLPQRAVEDTSGGGMQVFLLDALLYALDRVEPTAEMVINCSFGTHGGPHNGSRMIDKAIQNLLDHSGLNTPPTIIFPVGNSLNAACHAKGHIKGDGNWSVTVNILPDKSTDTFIEWWVPVELDLNSFNLVAQGPRGIHLELPAHNHCSVWSEPGRPDAGPVVTLIRSLSATQSHHRFLAVIGPTSTLNANGDSAPYGHWSFDLVSTEPALIQVEIQARIERDDAFFHPQVDRQSRFVASHQEDIDKPHLETWISKKGTNSPYTDIPGVKSVGALTRPTEHDTHLASSGISTMLALYSAAAPDGSPHYLAYVDDSSVLWGRLAQGHRARMWVRRNGTSVAAPQVARALINGLSLPTFTVQPNTLSWHGTPLDDESQKLHELRLGGRLGLKW